MSISMSSACLPVCASMLGNLSHLLDKMQAFIDAIEGRPNQVGTGEDGRAAVEVCAAMMKSSADKCWIFPGKVS